MRQKVDVYYRLSKRKSGIGKESLAFVCRTVEDLDEYISTLKQQCEVNPKDIAAEKIKERRLARQEEKERRRKDREEKRKAEEEKQSKNRKSRRTKKKGLLVHVC